MKFWKIPLKVEKSKVEEIRNYNPSNEITLINGLSF